MTKAMPYRSALLVLILLLFLPFLSAFFYTPSSEEQTEFNEGEIAAALEEARSEMAALTPEDDASGARQKVLFFETALRFSLNVWDNPFLSDAASEYALVLREWEILLADPDQSTSPRSRELEGEEAALRQILETKDRSTYLSFLNDRFLRRGFSEREAKEMTLQIALRIPESTGAGTQLLHREIITLEESLQSGKNQYDPTRTGASLSQKDRNRLESILAIRLHQIKTGEFDPIPANTETLSFLTEGMAFCLLIGGMLLGCNLKKNKHSLGKPLLCYWLSGILISTLSVTLSALFFAPASLIPHHFVLFGAVRTIPFILAFPLRFICITVPTILPLLLAVLWSKYKPISLSVVCVGLLTLLYSFLSLSARLALHQSPWLNFLPFRYLDLASLFFPQFPEQLPGSPNLIASLLVLGVPTAMLLYFLQEKKEQT